MRLKFLFLLVAASLSFSAGAADKKMARKAKSAKKISRQYQDFPRLLTARELLAMGPVKRQEYFQNLRVMMNELDKLSFLKLGRLVAGAEALNTPEFVARYPAFLELFQYVLPAAHAADCLDPRYPFAVGSMCGSLCATRPIGSEEVGRAVQNVYFCFPKASYDKWNAANRGNGSLQLPRDLEYLNPGTFAEREPKIIEAQRRKAAEVLHANAEAEERDLGRAMRQSYERHISENIDNEEAEAGRAMRQSYERHLSENIDNEEAEAGRAMRQSYERHISENIDREDAEAGVAMKKLLQEAREREISENIDREDAEAGVTMKKLAQEAREREVSENIDREDAEAGAAMRKMAADAEDRKRIAEREKLIGENIDREEADRGAAMRKAAKEKELAAQSKVTKGASPEKTPEKGLTDGKCTLSKLSCTDRDTYLKDTHKGALKTFRASKPVNCVSAGNMSQYAGNQVKAGNCGVVRDFCIRKDDCSKAAEDAEGGFKTRYSCPSGQAICSPFIYGLENKQKAICVAQKGRHLTEACDDKAKALKGKDGYVGDFLGQAPAGVAEAWDEYAQAFNGTCRQKTESQDAHCLECGVIGRRLQEARALASGSCTDALGYKQIKPGSGSAPGATK